VKTLLAAAGAALAGAALLSGCGPSSPSTSGRTDHGNVKPVEVGWSDVSPAEKVRLPAGAVLNGRPESPGPGRVVLINFWASTCGPCRKEMPMLEHLDESGEAMVIGVTRDRFASNAAEAINRAKVTYPNYQDFRGDYTATFHGVVPLGSVPMSVLIVDGEARRIHIGPFEDLAELRAGLRP
jgi:thiol-disulfide isomerase/thioredoxin